MPLFQPFKLRSLTVENRIVMSPMTREFSPAGVPGTDVAAYYRRRAEGGVGLIVTEGVGIDNPAAVDGSRIPVMHGDAALEGWKHVVDGVHAAGGKIIPQLWHQGPLRDPLRSDNPEIAGLRPSGLWGTPGVTTYPAQYLARMHAPTAPMTDTQISEVVRAYAQAARNAVSVGFDGIAIHAAHGYLIDCFFWADTNRRMDRYGGSARERATFGVEVVRAIRAAIGEDLPIVLRFSQHKQQNYKARIADTPDELGAILGPLADAGVDLFDASGRRFSEPAFAHSELTLSGWARKLTGKPSIAVGGVGLPNRLQDTPTRRGETMSPDNLDEVHRLFALGMFDLVAVGRALLNDPHWAVKARRGEAFLPFDSAALSRLQ